MAPVKRIDTAVLLCAGLGTRLRPISDRIPKPLVPLLGLPLIQYQLDLLNRFGFKRVVINLHHHADRLRDAVTALDRGALAVEFSDERETLLGSGGGIRTAASRLQGEPFIALNGDVLFDVDLEALRVVHARTESGHGPAVTLVLRQNESTERYRELAFASSDQRITRIGELASGTPFFTGVSAFSAGLIDALPVGEPFEFVPRILAPSVASGRAFAHVQTGRWLDFGSPQLVYEGHFALMRALEEGAFSFADRARRSNVQFGPSRGASARTEHAAVARRTAIGYFDCPDARSLEAYADMPIVAYGAPAAPVGAPALVVEGLTIPCDDARLRLI